MARPGDHDADAVDALLAAVGRGADDAAAAASARNRSQRRWLRQQAAESSTLAGVLLTLAERQAPVRVGCGPWTHQGRLRSVTASLAIVEGTDGIALLPTTWITTVEAAAAVADDRLPGAGPDLAAVLGTLTPERPEVRLLLGDGTEVVGTLLDLGKDVAVIGLTSSVTTVRLSALAGCILAARGNSRPAGSAQADESEVDLGSVADFGSG